MFKIISKKILAPNVKQIQVIAPEISKRVKAGQFIILRINELGERIPLTVASTDINQGSITLIFQEIGKTTSALGTLNVEDSILDIVGPLGHPTDMKKLGTVAAIGGGVGVAEILPVAKAYRDAGNKVIGIIGARNKELVILENEMQQACDELHITTDDGSYKRKGFVSDVLNEIIKKGEQINLVYAIGPVPMMKVISNLTQPQNIETIVSLNPIMVDGTGMCGACRVTVGGKTLFACVDGPEFNGHQVDWDELTKRLNMFKDKEKVSLDKFNHKCKCKS
ncbi:MAG: sulfide/dihydroorotate dehydrogenase-like FAD/NAD-binding protein [Endomicrobiales bacterium]|nr:sulfide/dihydroorotate dehydrogenase-like FAD/NAD-binding protein [Endomicrobiales bacterium]